MSGDRLTKHIHDNYYTLDEKFGSLAIMKLGKIEDIEEKIGTSLEEIATPKKPNIDYVIDDTYCFCPVCGHIIIEKRMLNTVSGDLFRKDNSFCSKCGQALDWSEEE